MSPCRDLQTIGKLEIWEISIASYDGRKELRSHKCVTKQISLLARFMLQGEKHPRISTFHHFIQHQEEFETRRAFNLFEAKAMWKRKKNVKKINLMMCQGVRRSNFYSGARQGKLDDSFFYSRLGCFAQRNVHANQTKTSNAKWIFLECVKWVGASDFPHRAVPLLRQSKTNHALLWSSMPSLQPVFIGSQLRNYFLCQWMKRLDENKHEHWMWPISHQHKTSTVN